MKLVCVTLLWVLAAVPPVLHAQDTDAAQDPMQKRAAATFANKAHVEAKHGKTATLTPLTPRERVEQLLDRFTFGPTPGELDQVLAEGADAWLTRQMQPGSINDGALARRLNDYPTVSMTPAQAMAVFPDRAQINAVANGTEEPPDDPLLHAVFDVQYSKLMQEREKKKVDGAVAAEPTEEERAAQKKLDQDKASQLFGELFALPKNQRMKAILALPVSDKIVLTTNGNLTGDQRNHLFADFAPREREAFQAMVGNVSSSGNLINELSQARVVRDILSERQLEAVMTAFWFNHFNIYAPKGSDQWYTASYERDVIRAHALSNFRDLLLATAESPAMMVYLDNWLSIGPDSLADGVNPQNPKSKKGNKGLNENYGREVMELHTVGVNGGYTQADVTSLSAILTGWGIDRPNDGGPFQFDYKRHEPGPKLWYGYIIDDNGNVTKIDPHKPVSAASLRAAGDMATPNSMKQGLAALNILANAPSTAHFISYLLAQYFVADDPPPALVDRLQKVFMDSHGDIKTVLRAIVASPEFNSRQYFHNKVKTPEEFIASAFRATATDPQNPGALVNQLNVMGMPLYRALPPTGYYLTADKWMNSTALVDRLNFAYQLTNSRFAGQKFDAAKVVALGLLSAPPSTPANGTQVTLHVLESTMIGAPVSAQTNQLIDKQLAQQPPNTTPSDTLNLLTALVMGSPEFQLR
ncbi:DUF1800 family protein [Granulicella sp. 5B5]|uniref:DUF1800 domain-containing protein n=1 Tax=Granulicella sp. 5B5 TaxID=1617967 RepID=UPI0015F41626|nr:DUF1800 domain-containing protein [Granulicella sp. 5B5]QMV20053.1 DUF1800 family protein [Granulicella sp. 5B5]